MRAYPLIRPRWSNEHVMAALFLVLLLYLIPQWIKTPNEIPGFLLSVALALLIDAVAGFLRHKRIVCCVSSAVTAAILQVLTPGIPLWGRLVGIAAALVLGKHLWGGTGKNNINPAITGYLVLCILFSTNFNPIPATILILPALILSIPFIFYRPFSALGYLGGMLLSLFISGQSGGLQFLITNIFIGCLIMTDPVTVTPQKLPGLFMGIIVGFLPMQTGFPSLTFAIVLLIFNLMSYLLDDNAKLLVKNSPSARLQVKRPYLTEFSGEILDLTDMDFSKSSAGISKRNPDTNTDIASLETGKEIESDGLIPQSILEKISHHSVYGLGGAAFPTAKKIQTVLSSQAEKKYFIINAVECDPGLLHDKWLLKNRKEEIQKGIQIIRNCVPFEDVILAIKDSDSSFYLSDFKTFRVEHFYPAGAERILIESVLKIKLPESSIPAQQGILVLNIQTVLSVYEAISLDRQADEKYITVADLKSGNAQPVKVKIGTEVSKILERVYPGSRNVYVGGGIMHAHMAEDTDLIESTTNFIAAADIPRYKESPLCSKCGTCLAHCPQKLLIQRIAELADANKYQEASSYHPEKCIQCGICSYVCPAGRNLSARAAEAKQWMQSNQTAWPMEDRTVI